MVHRYGRYDAFLGCSRLPAGTYTPGLGYGDDDEDPWGSKLRTPPEPATLTRSRTSRGNAGQRRSNVERRRRY